MLPSITRDNQRSIKQIKGNHFSNEKTGLSTKDRDTELNTRRNDGSMKIRNQGGIQESPILSQSKLPERQLHALGSQGRPDSFRIRQTNPGHGKNII